MTEVGFVNPARAMGIYLRTWRREWAGLSRAQLALAVSAGCSGHRRVTPRVIEKWEAGQPPQCSEELLALERVMARHGLKPEEVSDFRRAVYAACAGHLYPELLEGDDWVHRPDVDGVAEALCRRCLTLEEEISVAGLLVFVDELTAAVDSDEGPLPCGAQGRRQRAALAFARGGLAMYLDGARGRMAHWTGGLLNQNADFIAAHFGPAGLGGRLSPLGQRVMAAWHHGHHGHSVAWAQRLLPLAEAAEAGGEYGIAADARLKAAHALIELDPGPWDHLLARAEAHLETAASAARPDGFSVSHLDLAWAQLSAGNPDAAEAALLEFVQWGSPNAPRHLWWHQAHMWVALCRGDLAGARLWVAPGYFFWPTYERAGERGGPLAYREWLARER